MAIHLYEDRALTQPLSEGDGSNPDEDTYNGTAGQAKDKELFLANEQTTLAAAVTVGATSLGLSRARFADGEVLLIDDEQLKISSGGGTTTVAVERGVSGTTAAAHEAGATVFSGYDYTGLSLEPVDSSGDDESDWYTLALTEAGLDTATAGGALTVGDKDHDATVSIWRRCRVPAATPVQIKTDLKLRLTGTENPLA